MAKDAQTIINKYGAGVKNGAQAWLDGVNAVKDAPGNAAANAEQKWFDKLNEAFQAQRFSKGCRAVTLQAWQDACKTKGKGAYANAAAQAQVKYGNYITKALPTIIQNQNAVRAMPKTTDQEAEARMIENLKRQRDMKGKFKG